MSIYRGRSCGVGVRARLVVVEMVPSSSTSCCECCGCSSPFATRERFQAMNEPVLVDGRLSRATSADVAMVMTESLVSTVAPAGTWTLVLDRPSHRPGDPDAGRLLLRLGGLAILRHQVRQQGVCVATSTPSIFSEVPRLLATNWAFPSGADLRERRVRPTLRSGRPAPASAARSTLATVREPASQDSCDDPGGIVGAGLVVRPGEQLVEFLTKQYEE